MKKGGEYNGVKAFSKKQLLDYLGVKNYKDLLLFIKKNPTNDRVIEIKGILILFGINLEEEWEAEI